MSRIKGRKEKKKKEKKWGAMASPAGSE